ncbi:hypothetical protein AtDm6_2534 [Acetobacter tropicalis]|uniref:Uncharacterized protein n=1 Tax=Acetobacter tropicalis TaxID=104102 RepID=A0A094ZI24_9PROT|nr:hypothetical protein AtDm6_2534 [Acetobacter tropicalis]
MPFASRKSTLPVSLFHLYHKRHRLALTPRFLPHNRKEP